MAGNRDEQPVLSAESPPWAVLDAHVSERHVFAGREKDW